MSLWIYPGTFDPITMGHLDVIKRASRLCGKLIVGVLNNTGKIPVFSVDERIGMIKGSIEGTHNIEVEGFEGLLVDYVRQMKADVIVRGVRSFSDFEHEFQMASLNRTLASEIETVFIMAAADYSFVSSTIVKEIAAFGGDLSKLVPPQIIKQVYARINKEDSI